jgi:hypothetical protein
MTCYYCDEFAPVSAYQFEGVWVWACAWCLLVRLGADDFFGVPNFIPPKPADFYSTIQKFENSFVGLF